MAVTGLSLTALRKGTEHWQQEAQTAVELLSRNVEASFGQSTIFPPRIIKQFNQSSNTVYSLASSIISRMAVRQARL